MSFYAIAEGILNQDRFSALIVILCMAALFRRDVKTLAFFVFALGYYSTQLPLVWGWGISEGNKLVMQGIVSLAMMAFYFALPATKPIVFAMLCELALITLGIVTVISNLHEWYHWAIVAIINYAELMSLCINKWGAENVGKRRPWTRTPFHAPDHVYTRAEGHFKKNPGSQKWQGSSGKY